MRNRKFVSLEEAADKILAMSEEELAEKTRRIMRGLAKLERQRKKKGP